MSAESVTATGKDVRVIGIVLLVGGPISSLFTGWVQSQTYLIIGSVLLLIASVKIVPRAETVEASHIDLARIKAYVVVAIGVFFLLNAF